MRALFILFSVVTLCGCASMSNPNLETEADTNGLKRRLDLLVGTPERELAARLPQVLELAGPLELLNADCRADGIKEIEFYWEHRYELPIAYQRPYPSTSAAVFGTYAFFGLGWSPSVNSAQPPVKPCTLRFTAQDGLVVAHRVEGPGCERFAPTLPAEVLAAPPLDNPDLILTCPK